MTISSQPTYSADRPFSMAVARNGHAYGVNGATRGFRYAGGTAVDLIGIDAATAVTASTTTSPLYHYIESVVVTDGGEHYYAAPSVIITGVSGAEATLAGDSVASVAFLTSATTHTSPPSVALSGGQAGGASLSAVVRGGVAGISLNPNGAQYFGNDYSRQGVPITFSANTSSHSQAVTEIRPAKALGRVSPGPYSGGANDALMQSVQIIDPGLYLVDGSRLPVGDSPVIASAPTVTNVISVIPYVAVTRAATVAPNFAGALSTITATTGGTNYSRQPELSFYSRGPAKSGGGAVALAAVTGGSVSGATIEYPGAGYDGSVVIDSSVDQAVASAVIRPRLVGKHLCGVRYIDSTPASGGGPVAGNFGPFLEVDCGTGASSITWGLSAFSSPPSNARVTHIELWRTSSGQAITLYRVASFSVSSVPGTFTDSLTDQMLVDEARAASGSFAAYASLPILTEDGYPAANRRGVPPHRFSVVRMFQDRAWFAVDDSGQTPNTLFFSEVDEPESVPDEYQITLQQAGRDTDSITALLPMDSSLYIVQRRHMYRLTVGARPLEDSSSSLIAQRGALNDRCWDTIDGIAYVADYGGLYAFDGSSVSPLSEPVATFWSEGTVDFSKSRWFFLRAFSRERVVRFFYVAAGSSATYPDRALCYSLVTKAWWQETFAHQMSCSSEIESQGVPKVLLAGPNGKLYATGEGLTDDSAAIAYSIKTGNVPLADLPRRGVRLTYTPAAATAATLGVSLYYNGSSAARAAAVDDVQDGGFRSVAGATAYTIDLGATPAAGERIGYAQVYLPGRIDDRSSGTDRNIAIGLSGTLSTGRAIIHRLVIEGAE